MLAAARARLEHSPNVELREGHIEALPLENSSLDVAILFLVAHFISDPAKAMEEVRRVLKPGGRLLVLEFMRPTSPLLQRGFGLFFKRVLPLIGRLISRHGSAYSYLPASVDGFCTRREFEALLRATGWRNVRSFNHSGGIATSFVAVK